jgi:hypothetical protein
MGEPMTSKKKQEYRCGVVKESVQIHLCKKPSGGLRSKGEFFVQCDQDECQYVDNNKLPCPLELSLFKEEIREREEKAQQQREASDYY